MSASNSKDKNKWKWDTTELKYFTNTSLSVDDIKQLCITRGDDIPEERKYNSKIHQIIHLTSNFDLDLTVPFQELTSKQLCIELKVRGLNHKMAKKSVLLSRLTQHCNNSAHNNGIWLLQSPIPYRCSMGIALDANVICIITKQGAYKYNIVTEQWQKWFIFCSEFSQLCLDTLHQRLIVHDYTNTDYHMSHIGIRSKQYQDATQNYIKIPLLKDLQIVRLAFINNELHIVGCRRGECHAKHIVLYQAERRYTVQDLDDIVVTEDLQLIAVPSREMILLFGQYVCNAYIYSTRTRARTWRVYRHLQCIEKLRQCASVLTMNERYIILFGGIIFNSHSWCSGGVQTKSDDIHVVDLATGNVLKSKIKCPVKSVNLTAIITNSTLQRNLIVFGYVRECWKTDEFVEYMMPPDYITRLIMSWYSGESVHLFNKYSGMHCMMNVSDIMTSLITDESDSESDENDNNNHVPNHEIQRETCDNDVQMDNDDDDDDDDDDVDLEEDII